MGTSQIIALGLGLVGAVAVRPLWRWDGRYRYTETVNGVTVEAGERESVISPRVCAVTTALASGTLLAVASSDDVARIVLPTAAIGLVGLVFLLMGASSWRNVDRETAKVEQVTRGATKRGLASTAFEEGPVEAVMQGFYSLFSIRGLLRFSAIVGLLAGLALLGLAVTFAVNTGEVPAAAAGIGSAAETVGVVVDVIELVGYAALTLLMLWFLLTADHETPVDAILVFLALYAISIGVGLWLGLLDGWIDILDYVF